MVNVVNVNVNGECGECGTCVEDNGQPANKLKNILNVEISKSNKSKPSFVDLLNRKWMNLAK